MKHYGNDKKRGIKAFLETVCFEDMSLKRSLEDFITDDTELIWYPGCGGDVSPCSVLERKHFEEDKSINTSNKRLYIFTDNGQYRMCKSAFGLQHRIYDNSVDDYSEKYTVEKYCEVSIVGELGEKIVEGSYNLLSLGVAECHLLFLKLPMQDFLMSCIKAFELDIKWLFYLKMESKGGDLFNRYKELGISFPEWICANRVEKFGIQKYADLKPMLSDSGKAYYSMGKGRHNCENVMYGRMNDNGGVKKMKQIEREKILEDITKKETRDNKVNFTVTTRLDYIRAKLSESDYEVYFETPLSVTYKKKNVILPERLVLLSTHIDCEKDIKKLDFKITKKGNYKGTFDNAVTNAVSVISMLEDTLNDNVIISFTGDEEEDSNGAIQVIEYLKELKKEVIAITLDATLDLKSEKDNDITTYKYASYTIDNLCANTSELFAKELFELANRMNIPYMVTRVDDDCGRDYFDHKDITDYYDIKLEAEDAALPDESIEYSRYDCCLCAFSLCIPTNTDDIDVMHSDKLLKIKKEAFYEYLDAVVGISNRMAQVSDMDKNVN